MATLFDNQNFQPFLQGGLQLMMQSAGLEEQRRQRYQDLWSEILKGKLIRKGQADAAHAARKQNELGWANFGMGAANTAADTGVGLYAASQLGKELPLSDVEFFSPENFGQTMYDAPIRGISPKEASLEPLAQATIPQLPKFADDELLVLKELLRGQGKTYV